MIFNARAQHSSNESWFDPNPVEKHIPKCTKSQSSVQIIANERITSIFYVIGEIVIEKRQLMC